MAVGTRSISSRCFLRRIARRLHTLYVVEKISFENREESVCYIACFAVVYTSFVSCVAVCRAHITSFGYVDPAPISSVSKGMRGLSSNDYGKHQMSTPLHHCFILRTQVDQGDLPLPAVRCRINVLSRVFRRHTPGGKGTRPRKFLAFANTTHRGQLLLIIASWCIALPWKA